MENVLYNLDIERALLSTLLSEPTRFDEISNELKPEAFYLKAHQDIYRVMEHLSRNSTPIDEQFIRKHLSKEKQSHDEVFLDILQTATIVNTMVYIKEILDLAIKRELVALTTEIKKVVYEEQLESEEAIARVQKRLFEIGSDTSHKDFRSATEIVDATLAKIEANKARGNTIVTGLDTGYGSLNRKTSGFGNGDLIIIGARPSMGKTAFMLSLAAQVLGKGSGVALFSLETSAEDLMIRLLAIKTGVNAVGIKRGNLTDDEWGKVAEASDAYAKSPLYIDDSGDLTLGKIRSRLRRLKLRNPIIKLAAIDYMGLITGAGNKERYQDFTEISRGLKMLARELDIPIVVLSQLSRGLETRTSKRPVLSDIRDSGAIEQDADIVMFVHREDYFEGYEKTKKTGEDDNAPRKQPSNKPESEAEIIIAKNRNGETGVVKMIFQKAYMRFVDVEFDHTAIAYRDTIVNIPQHLEMPQI